MILSSILYSPGNVPTLIKSLSLSLSSWLRMEKIHNCTEWPSFSDHELQGSAQHRSAILWVLLLLVSMLSGSQNQLCSPSSFQNYNAPISGYGPTSFFAIRDNSYLFPTPNLYTLLSPLYKNCVLQLFHILLYHWFPSLLDQIISISRHAMLSPPKRKNPPLSPSN